MKEDIAANGIFVLSVASLEKMLRNRLPKGTRLVDIRALRSRQYTSPRERLILLMVHHQDLPEVERGGNPPRLMGVLRVVDTPNGLALAIERWLTEDGGVASVLDMFPDPRLIMGDPDLDDIPFSDEPLEEE